MIQYKQQIHRIAVIVALTLGLPAFAVADPQICPKIGISGSKKGIHLKFAVCGAMGYDAESIERFDGSVYVKRGVTLTAEIKLVRKGFGPQVFKCGKKTIEEIDWVHRMIFIPGAKDKYLRQVPFNEFKKSKLQGICLNELERKKEDRNWIINEPRKYGMRKRISFLKYYYYDHPFEILIPKVSYQHLNRSGIYYFEVRVIYNGNSPRISGVHFKTDVVKSPEFRF